MMTADDVVLHCVVVGGTACVGLGVVGQVLAGHRRQLGHGHVQVQGSHARGKPAVCSVHTVG